jgi:protein TonB
LIAVVLSVGVHVAALLLVVTLPHIVPTEAQPHEQGTVELLMVEQKGAQPVQGGPPADTPAPATPPLPDADPPKAVERKDAPPTPRSVATPAPPPSAHGDEPAPRPAENAEAKAPEAPPATEAKQAEAQPVAPHSREAPVFDLEGTESESNAVVLGGRVLPASRDDRFRNRPPLYPYEAEERGEHGSVTLVIHVSANGLAAGVDVLESSGYDILDQAAVTAVRKWHFRPAMQEGRSIPFDMPFRFIFEP